MLNKVQYIGKLYKIGETILKRIYYLSQLSIAFSIYFLNKDV